MITIVEDNKGPKWVINELHGRQDELNMIKKIADGDSSGCVLLEGCEGCGKKTLMQALNWEERGWIYVGRRFETHLSSEPYSALTRAVDELVEIWCRHNESSPDECKMSELLDLVEADMDLLQNIIPGLFRVIDKFTQSMHRSRSQRRLSASQARASRRQDFLRAKSKSYISRSQTMMERTSSIKELTSSRRQRGQLGSERIGGDPAAVAGSFISLFSFFSSSRPIVLSIEDVHFADAASMEILRIMAHTASTHPERLSSNKMLLVLTYSGLLEENKFASRTITKIKTFESNIHYLCLKGWDIDTLNEFVASLVKAEPEESLPLTSVIHKKTGGHPLAVSQFLVHARQNGHLKFSSMTCKWEWEDVEVLDQFTTVSDNVAEVLAASMVKLNYATKMALKVASCLGNVIPQDVIVEYFAEGLDEESKGTTVDARLVGLQEDGLLELLEGATKAGILVKSTTAGAFMWSNDRLQQAAYESLPKTMRNELHLKLGRLLWELGLIRDEEWMIFMAANQMNKYSELQSDSCMGNEVAELNLQAATLSLNKGAIYPALELLLKAEKHMEAADRWKNSYELTLDIMTTLAEAKLRVGETETAMAIATEVVQNSKSHDDTFPAHIIMLQCVVSGNDRNYEKGVERTLLLLKFYGEKHSWKFYPGHETVEKTKLKSKIKKALPTGEVEDLLDMHAMTDLSELRIQVLLVNHLAQYAAHCPKYKALSWFASARALKSSCKNGISPVTNLALIQMAANLRVEGQYKEAAKYAEIALTLTDCLPRHLGSDHGQVRMIACGSVFSAVSNLLFVVVGCNLDLNDDANLLHPIVNRCDRSTTVSTSCWNAGQIF